MTLVGLVRYDSRVRRVCIGGEVCMRVRVGGGSERVCCERCARRGKERWSELKIDLKGGKSNACALTCHMCVLCTREHVSKCVRARVANDRRSSAMAYVTAAFVHARSRLID